MVWIQKSTCWIILVWVTRKKMDDSKENYYSLLYVGFNINFFASDNLWQPHEQNAYFSMQHDTLFRPASTDFRIKQPRNRSMVKENVVLWARRLEDTLFAPAYAYESQAKKSFRLRTYPRDVVQQSWYCGNAMETLLAVLRTCRHFDNNLGCVRRLSEPP